MLMISEQKVLAPAVFHFAVPGQPCTYWDNGNHIVRDGVCLCGKAFLLIEKEAVA
jgi:hypothetical protein